MTLAEELQGKFPTQLIRGRMIELEGPPLRLPFNGELSPDEMRMSEQFTFSGPASWEEDDA